MFSERDGIFNAKKTVLTRIAPAGANGNLFSIRLPPCRWRLNFYNPSVLDIKLIREKTDFVRSRLATRGGGDETKIDELLKLDEQRRKLLVEVEKLDRKSGVVGRK